MAVESGCPCRRSPGQLSLGASGPGDPIRSLAAAQGPEAAASLPAPLGRFGHTLPNLVYSPESSPTRLSFAVQMSTELRWSPSRGEP